MAEAKKTKPLKKTIDEQIAETEAKLKNLRSKKAEQLLGKTAPGMGQLLAAIDAVVAQNGKCKVVDIVKSISKIKRLGLTIAATPRKKREPKQAAPSTTVSDSAAPRPRRASKATSKAKK